MSKNRSTLTPRQLALRCAKYADDKKAENILILDVRGLTSFTQYFVIASGTSEPHLRAICDEITERLNHEFGIKPIGVDGTINSAWVVLDYDEVVVHLMRPDVRERYDLEGLWGDAKRVKLRRQTRSKSNTKQN
jgi:ribosome-associated protein